MLEVVLKLLKALFSSKRFVTLLITGAVLATNKLGLDLDPETLEKLVVLSAAYITGVSISDTWGKGAIEALSKGKAELAKLGSPDKDPS